jgi:release factor glutamine methyltransferase
MRLDDARARHRAGALERGVNPRDVDLLLTDLLQKSTAYLYSHGDLEIETDKLEALLERRFAGEPLQYIRGKAEFFSREFLVDTRALIPRPETELVVETALGLAPDGASVLDIGTGTGCIAISIERERPDLRVVSVDRSVEALALASLNRSRLQSKVRLVASDVMTALRGDFDVIVSNPPYVPLPEYEELADEVRVHEPRMALTPGPKGTEIIERILSEHRARLVIMEVGYGQEVAIRELATATRWNVDAFLPDLAGIARVVVLSPHGG